MNPDNFISNISTATVTFTETSVTNNATLLSRIVTGSGLNTIIASVKNLLYNINNDITYQEITYENWLNLTEQQKENGNWDVTGVPSISSSSVILYDGASFNDKNEHTLNDTISNYKCIEVITNQGSQKFFTNKSSSVELRYSSTGYDVTTPSNGGVILYLHFLHFNNNKIAIGNAHRWYWYKTMSAWTYEFTNTSSWIYIARIIGYK